MLRMEMLTKHFFVHCFENIAVILQKHSVFTCWLPYYGKKCINHRLRLDHLSFNQFEHSTWTLTLMFFCLLQNDFSQTLLLLWHNAYCGDSCHLSISAHTHTLPCSWVTISCFFLIKILWAPSTATFICNNNPDETSIFLFIQLNLMGASTSQLRLCSLSPQNVFECLWINE